MKEKFLIQNSVTCLECGETLISYYGHDYKTCSCPQATMVVGGNEYGRYGGMDLDKVQTNYIYSDAPFEQLREVITRGSRGKDGKQPLTYIKLKDIDNEYLDALIDYEELNRPSNKYLTFYKQEKEWRKEEHI